jgi:hypothetical protein
MANRHTSDPKKDMERNQRKQRAFVEDHQKQMREVTLPSLREKKRHHSRRVERLQERNHKTVTMQKNRARDRIREQQAAQKMGVLAQKVKITEQQIKQRANARAMQARQHALVTSVIAENRESVERQKMKQRLADIKKGKLVFSYPTMPSNHFSDSTTYSPKHSTVPDPEFAETIVYSPKYSLVPDPTFSEILSSPSKYSLVPKPEFAEAGMYSSELSTVPKTHSLKYSILQLGSR